MGMLGVACLPSQAITAIHMRKAQKTKSMKQNNAKTLSSTFETFFMMLAHLRAIRKICHNLVHASLASSAIQDLLTANSAHSSQAP
jgi:hypothetical protein